MSDDDDFPDDLHDFYLNGDDENIPPLHRPTSPIIVEHEQPDPEPANVDVATGPVTFTNLTKGTKRKRDVVASSDGNIFTKSKKVKDTTYYQCAYRGGERSRCPATVKSRNGTYIPGKQNHRHDPNLTDRHRREVYRDCKEKGEAELYKSGIALSQDVLRPSVEKFGNSPNLPTPKALSRAVNYNRKSLRPKDPIDLNFEIDAQHVEGFLQGDITVKEHRRLIFATNAQLLKLSQAKRWYMDGTFKVVKPPFTQLYTIYAFIQRGHSLKQVPLVFILMSGRKAKDYKRVFEKVKELIDNMKPEEVVLDYGKAAWKASREAFPGVKIKGCAFHANQSVYKKIKEIGLSIRYINDIWTQYFCRKLMSLIYLPPDAMMPLLD